MQKSRRFSTKNYPIFAKSEIDENSAYYYWFRFMQLYYSNNNKKHAVFGDIRQLNFKQFWNKFDTYFLEELTAADKHIPKIANSKAELAAFNSEDVVNVVIPLKGWNKTSIRKYFEKNVMSKVVEGKKGINVAASTAEYKLSRRFRISAFQRAYDVYKVREFYQDYKWYDVAIAAECFSFYRTEYNELSLKQTPKSKKVTVDVGDLKTHTVREKNMGKVDEHIGLRNTCTVLALRHFKRAEKFIAASVTKKFP